MRDLVRQPKSLFISAGHSDSDPGATANGVTEADVVLEFRDLLASYLKGRVAFDMDGSAGKNLPLSEAARMASSHDIALEFHCNAFNGKPLALKRLAPPSTKRVATSFAASFQKR